MKLFFLVMAMAVTAHAAPDNATYYRECYSQPPLETWHSGGSPTELAQTTINFPLRDPAGAHFYLAQAGLYQPQIKITVQSWDPVSDHIQATGAWEQTDFRRQPDDAPPVVPTDAPFPADITITPDAGIGAGWVDLATFTYMENGVPKKLQLSCLKALKD